MSGLQASISTLLSREYYFPNKTWGENVPLFMRAVGSHQDRLSNLYFTFLFTLRSVVKAGDYLASYKYDTGNSADDIVVKKLIRQLVGMQLPPDVDQTLGTARIASNVMSSSLKSSWSSCGKEEVLKEVEECRNGFDESHLFQVITTASGSIYAVSDMVVGSAVTLFEVVYVLYSFSHCHIPSLTGA